MAIPYQIAAGEHPDDAYQELYQKQEDGSYILQIDGLDKEPASTQGTASQETTDQDGQDKTLSEERGADASAATVQSDSDAAATACFGAGTQLSGPTQNTAAQTIIAPYDSQTIQKSLDAIARGTVRLG